MPCQVPWLGSACWVLCQVLCLGLACRVPCLGLLLVKVLGKHAAAGLLFWAALQPHAGTPAWEGITPAGAFFSSPVLVICMRLICTQPCLPQAGASAGTCTPAPGALLADTWTRTQTHGHLPAAASHRLAHPHPSSLQQGRSQHPWVHLPARWMPGCHGHLPARAANPGGVCPRALGLLSGGDVAGESASPPSKLSPAGGAHAAVWISQPSRLAQDFPPGAFQPGSNMFPAPIPQCPEAPDAGAAADRMGHTPKFPQEKARRDPGMYWAWQYWAGRCRAGVTLASPSACPRAVGTPKLGLARWDVSPTPQRRGVTLAPLSPCSSFAPAAQRGRERQCQQLPTGRPASPRAELRAEPLPGAVQVSGEGRILPCEPRAALEGLC